MRELSVVLSTFYADLPPRFRGLAVVFAEGVPEVPQQDITTSA